MVVKGQGKTEENLSLTKPSGKLMHKGKGSQGHNTSYTGSSCPPTVEGDVQVSERGMEIQEVKLSRSNTILSIFIRLQNMCCGNLPYCCVVVKYRAAHCEPKTLLGAKSILCIDHALLPEKVWSANVQFLTKNH